MARLATAINQYQTNNNGKIPKATNASGTSDLPATTDLAMCTSTEIACTLVRTYLNSVDADENEFVDPDGTAYGLTIYNNASTATAPTTLDHIVHVYGQAECNGEFVEPTSNPRDYAIVYKMEGSGTYCKDSR